MIIVKPLNEQYLKEASNLANSVFSYEKILPNNAFEASLDRVKLQELREKDYIKAANLEYFVALADSKIVGTTGLYNLTDDPSDVMWVGWYCVAPDYRSQGIGKVLLDFTINEARGRGKKRLRLYTSTRPEEENAQKVYEHNGFWKQTNFGKEMGNMKYYSEKRRYNLYKCK